MFIQLLVMLLIPTFSYAMEKPDNTSVDIESIKVEIIESVKKVKETNPLKKKYRMKRNYGCSDLKELQKDNQ